MYVSIENCDGGFLIEVRDHGTDETILSTTGQRDWKKVCTSFVEVEGYVRQMFLGKTDGK
jgi:hypothetical protein